MSSLAISSGNIEDMLERAVANNAVDCFRVVLEFQEKHKDVVQLDHAKLFARMLTVFDIGMSPVNSGLSKQAGASSVTSPGCQTPMTMFKNA